MGICATVLDPSTFSRRRTPVSEWTTACGTLAATRGPDTTDVIHLRGLPFYGYHGALAEERSLGQRFERRPSARAGPEAAG